MRWRGEDICSRADTYAKVWGTKKQAEQWGWRMENRSVWGKDSKQGRQRGRLFFVAPLASFWPGDHLINVSHHIYSHYGSQTLTSPFVSTVSNTSHFVRTYWYIFAGKCLHLVTLGNVTISTKFVNYLFSEFKERNCFFYKPRGGSVVLIKRENHMHFSKLALSLTPHSYHEYMKIIIIKTKF